MLQISETRAEARASWVNIGVCSHEVLTHSNLLDQRVLDLIDLHLGYDFCACWRKKEGRDE